MKDALIVLNLIGLDIEAKQDIYSEVENRGYRHLLDGHYEDDISLWEKAFDETNEETIRMFVEKDFGECLGEGWAHMVMMIGENEPIGLTANENKWREEVSRIAKSKR